MNEAKTIGFIGLGVMGEPICRNMLTKSGLDFIVFDLAEEPVARLKEKSARGAQSIADLAEQSDIVFLSLPGGKQVEEIIAGEGGILEAGREGQIVVDLSTAPVGLARELAERLEAKNMRFADAPVARTRQAAEAGTLSIMVGAPSDLFHKIEPLLAMAATDVTHCGDVGCGQVLKILNNMVLFQNVVALSEALALGEAAGVERHLLFDTISKGSGDSFALRNHGLKAMAPDSFPVGAFSTDYALKDISYALELARELGFSVPGAELAETRLQKASKTGFGQNYFPVLARVVDRCQKS